MQDLDGGLIALYIDTVRRKSGKWVAVEKRGGYYYIVNGNTKTTVRGPNHLRNMIRRLNERPDFKEDGE